MRKVWVQALGLSLLVACGEATTLRREEVVGPPGANIPSLESARADYLSWHPFTEEPEAISTEIFALCRLPTLAEQEFTASEHGDYLALRNWLNEEAQQGFANKADSPFPVGATIVKEKLRRGDAGWELAALGISIKHPPGFDSQHGDWEFGYWEPESGMSSGANSQAYCGACHATSTTDFVFLDHSWRSRKTD